MEQVLSLINKLEQQIKQGVTANELLNIIGLLKSELQSMSADKFSQRESVAVWLPAGYRPAPVVKAVQEEVKSPAVALKPMPEPVQVETRADEPLFVPLPPKAPTPPQVVSAKPAVTETPLPEENVLPEHPVIFQLNVKEEQPEEIPVVARKAAPVSTPEPAHQPAPKPFPQYPDAETIMKNNFPATQAPRPLTRDLNELVAERIERITALNQRLHVKKVELAEVLVTGNKISDIRKAITINEKYQMINTLFRGDEDMFERSIRTLNNFGSLPEARFWMQRELILKLGWNEDDELVQHFHMLVSRRFS